MVFGLMIDYVNMTTMRFFSDKFNIEFVRTFFPQMKPYTVIIMIFFCNIVTVASNKRGLTLVGLHPMSTCLHGQQVT